MPQLKTPQIKTILLLLFLVAGVLSGWRPAKEISSDHILSTKLSASPASGAAPISPLV
jgi:hypothetical protein